jgi:hypothetical protein
MDFLKKGADGEMSFEILSYLAFGVLIFVLGLTAGWGMRGSMKEAETLRQKKIMDEIEAMRWEIKELAEGE